MCGPTTMNNKAMKGEEKQGEITKGALRWSNLYNSAPKLYIPFTQFDIGFSILSFCILCLLRFGSEYFFINILQFNPDTYKTIESASAVVSMTHAIVLCSGLWSVLRSQPYNPIARIDNAPKEYKSAVTGLLSLCTGYMFYDFIFILRWSNWKIHPEDSAFVVHHFATILYMSMCRIMGIGHISAMSLMFTGELTNPLQNGHLITKFGIQLAQKGSIFHKVHPYIELLYCLLYVPMRGIVGPLQNTHITYQMLFTKEGRENFNILVSIVMIIVIWAVILGSIPWTIDCWGMIMDGLEVKYDENWDYGPRYEL